MPKPISNSAPNRFKLAAIVAAVGIVLVGLVTAFSPTINPDPLLTPDTGTRLQIIDGSPVSLGELRGKVVVLDFWATTCAICLVELPEISHLGDELRDRGVEFVAVAMPYDRPDFVLDYVRKSKLSIKFALDPLGKTVQSLGPIVGTPTLVILDRRGRVARRLHGRTDISVLRTQLLALLAHS